MTCAAFNLLLTGPGTPKDGSNQDSEGQPVVLSTGRVHGSLLKVTSSLSIVFLVLLPAARGFRCCVRVSIAAPLLF